jgi:hypothetical protein
MSDIYGPRLAVASTAMASAATAMASATVSAEAGMPCETVSAEAGMPCETVAKAAMESMVMVEVAEVAKAAILKIERAIDWIAIRVIRSAIVRPHRASGEEKTRADQEGYRLRHHSAAIHRSLHSCEVRQIPPSRIAIGDLHHCSA